MPIMGLLLFFFFFTAEVDLSSACRKKKTGHKARNFTQFTKLLFKLEEYSDSPGSKTRQSFLILIS